MYNRSYSNFVRASLGEQELPLTNKSTTKPVLSGDEVRRLYLEEVKNETDIPNLVRPSYSDTRKTRIHKHEEVLLSNKDLFRMVQNNNIDKIKLALDKSPDKINILDDFGWSLLMIACQANSIDCAQELLKRGIDISVRDKAGNSARSLVIKNKNYTLAGILLSNRETESKKCVKQIQIEEEYYKCDICSKTFPDKNKHLSSTIHNINASKGKKITSNYVIPASNRGYQLMLKGGWVRDSGLGRDGHGKKYPIKTVQKKDRKGLGHKKIENKIKTEEHRTIKHKTKQMISDHNKKLRSFEINFRREFY